MRQRLLDYLIAAGIVVLIVVVTIAVVFGAALVRIGGV